MNQDFEDIRRAFQHLLMDVEPKDPYTLSIALTHYAIGIDNDKKFRASAPEPRIREVSAIERTDGWRTR